MKTLKSHLLIYLLCCLFWSISSHAKDYVVDIIIFENLAPQQTSEYIAELYYPRQTEALELGSGIAEAAGFTVAEPHAEMLTILHKLNVSSRYQILSHLTWQQPGLAEEDAIAIKVNSGEEIQLTLPLDADAEAPLVKAIKEPMLSEPDLSNDTLNQSLPTLTPLESVTTSRLAGTLTVTLGKYLHLHTNLVFIKEDLESSARMILSKRMRSRELHYLDNPDIGLIALMTPVEEPEESEETAETGEIDATQSSDSVTDENNASE